MHRDKPVVTVTRNPFSRYKSIYFYRWWEQHPPMDRSIIAERYPHFPDLSFGEYYEMEHKYSTRNHLQDIQPKIDLGLHTIQFVQFYFSDPAAVLRKIDDAYIEEEQFWDDMAPVHFIHQENLNAELKAFLLHTGAREREVRFVETTEKVNVTNANSEKASRRSLVLQDDTAQKILRRDRLIFKAFPEYLE